MLASWIEIAWLVKTSDRDDNRHRHCKKRWNLIGMETMPNRGKIEFLLLVNLSENKNSEGISLQKQAMERASSLNRI